MQEKLLEILRDTDSDDSSRKEIEKQVSTGPFAVETLAEEYKELLGQQEKDYSMDLIEKYIGDIDRFKTAFSDAFLYKRPKQ